MIDPCLGAYDTLCIVLDIFPEHTYKKYQALVSDMERELTAIGADARADEARTIDLDPEEVIRDAHVERDDPDRTEDS